MNPAMLKLARALFTQADGIGIGEPGLWVARTGFIARQRAALTDLLEDYLRAVRFYTDPKNQAEAAAIGAAVTKLPVSAFETWLFTKKDYYRDPAGRIDVASLQATFAVQNDPGFLKTTIDASRYVDLSVIEEAGRRLR